MLSEGKRAPDFTLPGTAPDEEEGPVEYSLADALADGPVLVNFYLFDFHPACTANMCDLQELAWFDLDEDLTVFGVSTDRAFSHDAFADEEELRFPLLSDSDGSVAEAFGVLYDEFRGHNRISKRSVFLIDADGEVRYTWVAETPADQPDWQEIKAAVDARTGAT
jgi:peroxiredoxin